MELSLKLSKPRSHTCATSVVFQGRLFVIVVGGWDDAQEYVADVDLFNVDVDDGSLTFNQTLELPADRSDDEARTKGTLLQFMISVGTKFETSHRTGVCLVCQRDLPFHWPIENSLP